MRVTTPSVETLLCQALEIPSAEQREAYIDRACAGNDLLRREVKTLLAAHYRAGDFLDTACLPVTGDLPRPLEGPGTVIGRYKLLEQIGEGGMGVVYMADQMTPVRRRVALKIIKPGMDSKPVITRFEAERQALALMDHPNIARVLDASATPSGRPYFVMELVKGVPITDYCDANHLDLDDRLDLFVLVCQAVQHAHQKGIIHRDLKPSNVMVTLHDGVPVPKVIDFGIAKATGQRLTDKTLFTAFAQFVGTPLYMSPEQAAMSEIDVDTRSDIYSLGVLLYELLTGSTPFDGKTFREAALGEIQRIIREEEPPKPSTRLGTLGATRSTVSDNRQADPRKLSHAVRGELDWIVMKALEKDRTRRYETASDFAADVMRHLSDRPVEACPPSAWYRFSKYARRNKATLTTATLIAAALFIGTGVSSWQAVRATQAEAQANANEAQARAAAGAERSAKQAEEKQRRRAQVSERRAQASERRANEHLMEVERHQKQAEKNLEAALEAVDRMLAHVGARELDDVARVGPLRRTILKDAVAFYERLPLQAGVAADIRFRVAQTWNQIAYLNWDVDETEPARRARDTANATLERLVTEQPGEVKYRANLADSLLESGRLHLAVSHNSREAEKLFRRASELYAALIETAAGKSWLLSHAHSLNYLSVALGEIGKRDEAIACSRRALDLLDVSPGASGFDRAQILYQWAQLNRFTPAEGDDLFRRAIDEYRKHLASDKGSRSERICYAGKLWAIACRGDFASREPDEAEKLLDESITLWREICDPCPSRRSDSCFCIRSVLKQARQLRRLTALQAGSHDPAQVAVRVAKAEGLFQEAIARQRETVSRFVLPDDRSILVQILQEESEYLLGQVGSPNQADDAARRLQADALLTEAIQISRQLVAEFPNDSNYGDRLTALLRTQANHFGQKGDAE